MVHDMETAIESYRFNDAASVIYQFTWATFCDWYLEFTKPILTESDGILLNETRKTASWVLKQIINALNPLMPYITEELWEEFKFGDLLINEQWPRFSDNYSEPGVTNEISWIISFITEIRSTRSAANVKAKSKVQILMKKFDSKFLEYVEANKELITRLGNLKSLDATRDDFPKGTIQGVIGGNLFGLVITDDIDFEIERNRILKELTKIKNEVSKFESKLNNKNFLEKAPQKVILETRGRLNEVKKKEQKLNQVLADISLS